MGDKKKVDMTSMYRALKELGHRRIWLRIIKSGDLLFMVTFENRRLARFDRSHEYMVFREKCCLGGRLSSGKRARWRRINRTA